MAQQNIDFGTFPDDPNADAIRTAFRKTQENFDQLFATAEQQAVLSVNRTPGAGITVNSPTGNVVVSANIACVQVSTSTLSIGISANGANSAVLTSTNQVLVVDLPNTISNIANISLVNNVTANYVLANIGTTTGNLTVNANTSTNNLTVLNNINSNTISVYDASVSNLTTLSGYIQPLGNFISTLRPNASSIDVGTVTSYFGNGYFDNVYVNNNFVSSNVNVNTLITTNRINVSSNANITGNILANNVSVNNNTITNNLTVNLAFTGNTANIVNISANTFTLNANPIMAVGVITPVYDTVYLPSNVVVSGTTSANATNVLSITVPSQGIYEFTSQMIVLPGTGASQPVSFGLYDGNGTLVANSEIMGATSDASNQKTTITGTAIVTSNASQTYTVKAWGTGLSPGILTYGGNGQSSLKYVRLDAVATITTNASVTFGNIITTSNVNVYNNLTVGGSIIGNVSGNFSGTISNGTSNLQIPIVNGNINLSASGSPNVFVVTGTGTNVTGTMQSTGNINTNGNLGVSGDAVIGGNLTVDGNIVYVNVETLDVEDPIINLQRGPNGAVPSSNSGKDVGTALNYFDGSAQIAWMGWDTSNAEISFASQVSIASEVVSYTQLANIRSGNANLGNAVYANFANIASNTITNNLTVNNSISANTANFSGNLIVPNLTVNNAINGNTANFSGNISVSDNANITGNLSVSGSIFGNISGNFTGTISNGTSNINIPSVNGNVNIVSGTVTSIVAKSTGANIFGTLDASGNITGLNLGTSGNVNATGNIQGSNIESANILVNTLTSGQIAIASTGGKLVGGPDLVWNFGNAELYSTGYVSNRYVTANGNVTGGNLITGGYLSVTGNANTGNLGTNTAIITTGNVTTINSGLLQNGTSNITLDLNGNVSTYIAGNTTAQFIITSTGANITGTLNVVGNANVGNLGSTDGVFTGNISANNLSTTNQITAGNGLQVTTGTVTILNGNLDITGNINATGNLNYSNVNDLVVGDPLIYIGANNTGDTYDLGLVGSYNEGTYYHTGIARNASDNYWTFFDGVVAEPTTVIDWANAVYPTVKLGNLLATGNANIAGYANIVGNANIGNVGTTFVIATSNITGANIYANSGTVGASFLTGTLTTATQPNITSLGTLTGLGVNGTVTASALTANTGVITGNGSGISALNASNISSGTLDQSRLANSSLTVNGVSISLGGSGTITSSTTNSITFDNAGTGSSSGVTFDGSTARTISYNTIGAPSTTGTNASGSWGISVTGSANTVTNAAQANITSVGTLTSLAVTGNITAGNVYANSGTIGASLLTGTLTTAAQPNITSVGSLTGLTSSGTINFTGASNVSLGAVGNLKITGGSSGQYLQTNGSGTLTWASVAAGYGDSNVATFLGSYGSNTISTTGNITGGNISGIMRPTSGSGTAGIIFPSDPGGGSGDVASIKWYAYSGEACYLELNVQNDSDDRIRLVASGGVQMNTGGLGVGTTPSGTDGEIRATNNITAYYSDDRLKKRLGVIENALDKVNSLTGFFYEANETAQELGYKPKREVGLSAQEVEKVLPEVVAPAPIDDKYKTLHYERIIPLLVEAIKEISAELSDLKNTLRNNNVK